MPTLEVGLNQTRTNSLIVPLLLENLPGSLIPVEIADHQREIPEFTGRLQERLDRLKTDPSLRDDFLEEMRRFLPAITMRDTLGQPAGGATSLR
jgi:hypothetical protein